MRARAAFDPYGAVSRRPGIGSGGSGWPATGVSIQRCTPVSHSCTTGKKTVAFGGFGTFLTIIFITYFIPLAYGFLKELLSITLKTISYLKIISNK